MTAIPIDLKARLARGEHVRMVPPAPHERSLAPKRPHRTATVVRQPTPHEVGEIRVCVGCTVQVWAVALLSRCEESGSVAYRVEDGPEVLTVYCQPDSLPRCGCKRYLAQWTCTHAEAIHALLGKGRL